ncbi:hypothetical protein G7046_g2986 [Stylonectria norvegica]|nr:hypothetical protein G7046_g2986 [Stylonectria norvegica]
MCALSAHQATKGALFSNELSWVPSKSLAEEFLQEALRIVPMNYTALGDINLLRSYGILVFIGAQTGDTDLQHRYMGLYQGLAARIGFHSEERWPSMLTLCEKETWRRVFWVMYRLEVHNACVLGHPIRTPESQTMVGYPCGVHHTPLLPDRNGKFEDWFAGWNYVTELYRILEHAINDFRRKRTALTTVLWSKISFKTDSILLQLSTMQSNLMPQFAQAAMKSSDSGSNRSGFQVANILCTIHLVKMVAFASEETSFVAACQTAEDLVDSMSTVPRDYIRSFGSPLMQELFGVGHMLTSVIGLNLSSTEHLRLRVTLLSLVQFIESFRDCIESAANAAFRLRMSLAQIDKAASGFVHNGSPKSVTSQSSWPVRNTLTTDFQNMPLALDEFPFGEPDAASLLPLGLEDFRFSSTYNETDY